MKTKTKKITTVLRTTKNVVAITKVKEEHGWLSCMSPHPVDYKGKIYKTCEALFQSLRFKNYPKIQEEIRLCGSPMGAKMIARKNRALLNRGVMWDESKSDLSRMKKCLLLKLKQHPQLKINLLKTKRNTILENCTTHDRESARFWGAVKKKGKWIGKNEFGKIWMEIRKELRSK